ncbi:MAG TPA: 5'-methylthioadenosine/S-adenosylhomocysteine nucleosidase [Thermomicrobiales bacterium]|nr:5'-methylthioadenosine/S-adenosylhomocysteine nucleosidase [Thermomicrobiales bacterium]
MPAISAHKHPNAPVAIIVAMRTELRHLFDALVLDEAEDGSADPALGLLTEDARRELTVLPEPNRTPLAGTWPVWSGTIAGHPIVAVLAGIGPANAAGALAALLGRMTIRAVISYGCAGAHRRDLTLGDVIIGDVSINHAAFDLLPDGTERYRGNTLSTGPDPLPPSETPSDPELLRAAHEAAADWQPEPWPTTGHVPQIHVGAVASADTWTQATARIDILFERHGTLCEEMETAALGVICQRLDLPLLPIKDISNNEYTAATDLGGAMDEFPLAEVGRRAAALTVRTIERLPGRLT